MPEKEIKVLLYGLGAIGSFYAFILSRNKNVVLDVVARSNYEAVKSKVGTFFQYPHQLRN